MADPTLSGVRLGQSRRLYVCSTKETTYGTATAVTHAITHSCDFPPLVRKPIVISDAAYASGNPSMSPRRNVVVGYTMEASFNAWLEHHTMNILVSALCGNDTYGAGTPSTHTCTLPDTLYLLPGHTFQENRNTKTIASGDGGIVSPGCAVTEVTISWQPSGLATISAKIMGNGNTTDSATITETGDLIGRTIFLTNDKIRVSCIAASVLGTSPWDGVFSALTVAAGVAGATEATGLANINQHIERGSIRLLAGAAEARVGGFSAAAGAYAGQPIATAPQAFLDLTWRADADTTTWLRGFADMTAAAQQEMCFVIDFLGTEANEYSKAVFPLATMTDNPGGGSGVGATMHDSTWEARKPTAGTPTAPFYFWSQNTIAADMN
jgi:hypothetical protein